MASPPSQFIKAGFLEALERPLEERSAFLAEHCAGDPEARRRIEALLRAQRRADEVLGTLGASPASPSPELAPGATLGPYRIGGIAGSGGFGTVYEARQSDPVTRRVALKVLRRGLDSIEARARFDAERQALALMEHASIARVFDAGTTDDGRPYLAMEFVDGVPITRYCEARALGLGERLELYRSVCLAVQHAHQKGVVHRDIKPNNVLVTEVDGAPLAKVIDFGIAKALGAPLTELSFVSIEGRLVGTPVYMSPEQAAGEVDVDTRTDVYALGVLLYELLAGTPPFRIDEMGLPELFRAIAERDPSPPSECVPATAERVERPRVPRDLDWIALRCLDKDRGRRYPSAGALAADVERFLAGLPVEAAPPSATYRLRKLARRHSFAFASAVAVVLALVLGAFGTGLGFLRARSANAGLTEALARANDEAERARQAERRAAEEARNAHEQWQVADDVNRFVTEDLLASAAPSSERGRGRDVLLRDVLDAASERLGLEDGGAGRFADAPVVEAAIRHMVGSVYSHLGEPEPAIAHLERAFALRTARLGPEHRDTLTTAGQLGDELRHTGRLERADAILTASAETCRRALGEDDALTIDTERFLGRLRRAQGRALEAYQLARAVHGRASGVLGSEHPTTLGALAELAISADAAGRDEEAEAAFRAVLDGSRKTFGDAHHRTITAMQNLGGFLRGRVRYEEAEPLLEEAYDRHRDLLGPEHSSTLTALYNLGMLSLERGEPGHAEVLLRQALEGWRATFGDEHADTLLALRGVAGSLAEQGRTEEAEVLMEESLETARRVFGGDHPVTDNARKQFVQLLFRADRRGDEMRALMEESLEVERRTLGPDHPSTLRSLANLANVEKRAGQLERAEEHLLEVLERMRATQGEESLDVLVTESDLADLYRVTDRLEEALRLARHAVEAGERTLSPEASDLGRFRLRLAFVLKALGRPEEAREVLLTVEALVATRGPADFFVRFARQELAELPPHDERPAQGEER